MEIVKIALVGVVGAIIFIYLKVHNSELSGLMVVATGILIILLTVDYLVVAIGFFKEMTNKTGIDGSVFKIIIKILAISYLADFSSSLCNDLGVSSLAEKVSFASRIIIFVSAFPVITNLFNTITSLIQ
ncbi:MAG: hypothetical protein IJA97_05480 [Clostridia bacterium]|nr:hypothetical protein [Clostridia bacterium]